MSGYPKIVAVVGTNASVKSPLGVELAKRYGAEIISADSRQVFRGLDLGSGKITPEEMQGVPHHLIDVREPGEFFSMAAFQRMSYAAIDGILARGHLPMIVGGTGLYVDSVLDGYLLSDREPDLAYRAEREKLTTPQLYDMLLTLVPDAQVDRNNRNRVMRMIERIHDGDDFNFGKIEFCARQAGERTGVPGSACVCGPAFPACISGLRLNTEHRSIFPSGSL